MFRGPAYAFDPGEAQWRVWSFEFGWGGLNVVLALHSVPAAH